MAAVDQITGVYHSAIMQHAAAQRAVIPGSKDLAKRCGDMLKAYTTKALGFKMNEINKAVIGLGLDDETTAKVLEAVNNRGSAR